METHVTEPASSTAAGIAAWKLGLFQKLLTIGLIGILGAAMMAAFDPPPTRKALFRQAAVAGSVAIVLTPMGVRWLDTTFDWITIASPEQWAEIALPVGFLAGAMSWGLMGALTKLRQLVHDKGAALVAERLGAKDGNQ